MGSISRVARLPGGSEVTIRIADSEQDRTNILFLRELVYVREQARLERASDVEENIFGRFEPFSTYFIACAGSAAVGCLRVISDSDTGLPCERNADLTALRTNNRLVEFGHFIAAPEYRSRGLGFLLLREALGFSVVCLNATHVLADIFVDEGTSLGAKYFLSRGFTQLGEIYCDNRFNGSPRSMVVSLDVNEGMRLPERALAVEEFRQRHGSDTH